MTTGDWSLLGLWDLFQVLIIPLFVHSHNPAKKPETEPLTKVGHEIKTLFQSSSLA